MTISVRALQRPFGVLRHAQDVASPAHLREEAARRTGQMIAEGELDGAYYALSRKVTDSPIRADLEHSVRVWPVLNRLFQGPAALRHATGRIEEKVGKTITVVYDAAADGARPRYRVAPLQVQDAHGGWVNLNRSPIRNGATDAHTLIVPPDTHLVDTPGLHGFHASVRHLAPDAQVPASTTERLTHRVAFEEHLDAFDSQFV